MTNFKKYVVIGSIILAMGATTAFAASNYTTPEEAVAGLTGETVEDIISQKNETGKTYGTIANEAGKLEEFKKEMLAIKKQILDKKVAAGTMTQEKADEIYAALVENQATCDGTGNAKIGKAMGAGFGGMMGKGQGRGQGQGMGKGMGQGLCNGSCQVQ